MTCCHEKCADPAAWLCRSHILTFSNSPSDSELIWLYKCTQLPRDLDTGTRDISISQTDVILITLNCLTLRSGFTCFLFLCGIQQGGGGNSGTGILLHWISCFSALSLCWGMLEAWKSALQCGWILTPYFEDKDKGLIRWKTIQKQFPPFILRDGAFHIFPHRSVKVVISNQCHRETLIIFDWGGKKSHMGAGVIIIALALTRERWNTNTNVSTQQIN